MKKEKTFAFTLAEILITLGIIGVVAAMTIPTLISNYQKKVWTHQLQHSYALLTQGFRRMLADDNTTSLGQTEVFLSIAGEEDPDMGGYNCDFTMETDSNNCKDFYTNLRKYFKIADIKNFKSSDNYGWYFLNGNPHFDFSLYTYSAIVLMDGTMIVVPNFSSKVRPYGIGNFYIDVNGVKKPNKYGRDLFEFYLGDDGILYPRGSKSDDEYWKTTASEYEKCENDGVSYGFGCAGRIMEEGKMNY
ncbi:type II secretion system protein [bacterium]|nr:type II secretion system protein [bacterium]